MNNLTPPITDAEGEEGVRRLNKGLTPRFYWPEDRLHPLLQILVQAMREPAWVPEVADKIASIPRFLKNEGNKPDEHPDWLLGMANEMWERAETLSPLKTIADALMTPPPKPPVDDATLCWREAQVVKWPHMAVEYNAGLYDDTFPSVLRNAMNDTLNWAKNREKRDD